MERTVVKSILQVTDAKVQELVHDQRAYIEQSLDTYSQDLQHLKQFTDTVETELGNVTYCQAKVKKSIRALCARQDESTAYVHTCRHKMQNDIGKLKQSQSHLMSTINEKFTLFEQKQTQMFDEIMKMIQCQKKPLHDRMETTGSVKRKAPDVKSFAYADHKTVQERKPCAYRTPSSSDFTSSDSSGSESENASVQGKHVKIPAFTGEESWNIWYTRFKEIATRQHWSTNDKLDVLLLKVQGLAAEFVFDQLSSAIRQDYRALTTALKNRFRKVANPKLYSMKFDACNQRRNQTAEDYAAELKMLYDKAFPRRNEEVRDDDLLRRFLSGLHDEEAQFQVEFVKAPTDIDSAVDEVVNFQAVRSTQSKSYKRAKPVPDSDTEDQCKRVWKLPYEDTANKSSKHKSDTGSPPKWTETLKEDLKLMIRREIEESTRNSESISAKSQRSNTQNWQNRPDSQIQTGYWPNTRYLPPNQQSTYESPCLYNPANQSPQYYKPQTYQQNYGTGNITAPFPATSVAMGQRCQNVPSHCVAGQTAKITTLPPNPPSPDPSPEKTSAESGKPSIQIDGLVENTSTTFTVDIGASASLLSKQVYDSLQSKPELVPKDYCKLTTANGDVIRNHGTGEFNITLGEYTVKKVFFVADIKDDVLLGRDLLQNKKGFQADLLLSENVMKLAGHKIPLHTHLPMEVVKENRTPTVSDPNKEGNKEKCEEVQENIEDAADKASLHSEPGPENSKCEMPPLQNSTSKITDSVPKLACSLMERHPSTSELHICHSDFKTDEKIPKWALRIANSITKPWQILP